jgi:hypothetical protein
MLKCQSKILFLDLEAIPMVYHMSISRFGTIEIFTSENHYPWINYNGNCEYIDVFISFELKIVLEIFQIKNFPYLNG